MTLRFPLLFALLVTVVSCRAPAPPSPQHEAAEIAAPDTPSPAPAAAQPEPAPAPVPAPTPEPSSAAAAAPSAALLEPPPDMTAPERFRVLLDTTKGPINIDVRRSWAPLGADRFYTLVKLGFFDGVAFFRVVEGFMVQTGLHGSPEVNRAWRTRRIPDDPVTQSNVRGMVSFATSGPNTRTTQFFMNLGDNARLDGMGFAPFGRVRELDTLGKIYSGYGEGAPAGRGPNQARIQREGNAFLAAEFPELDYIKQARVEDETATPKPRQGQ